MKSVDLNLIMLMGLRKMGHIPNIVLHTRSGRVSKRKFQEDFIY